MNKYNLIIVIILTLISLNGHPCYAKLKFIVPPFENFSRYKSDVKYEVVINDPENPSTLLKIALETDQYSEAARSLLENVLKNNGLDVIERLRVDQMIGEAKLSRKEKFINKESALAMGEVAGANTLAMGSILNFHTSTEEINAYGIHEKIIKTYCKIRVRFIDIESGHVDFSEIATGESTSSTDSYKSDNSDNPIYLSLEDAINNISSKENFKQKMVTTR